MPGCSKQTNPRGIEITFDEGTHRYSSVINGQEISYTSGTTFVSKFFPAFDPTGDILKRCAERAGTTPELLSRQWREKGIKSCQFGTKIHETMEDVLRGDMIRNRPENEQEAKTMKNAMTLARKILKKFDVVGIEKIVFDERIKIAGTMDLFCRVKNTGQYIILDHKTNEKIETENRFRKFAYYPIQNVADTKFSHYALQLNLYENILKRAEYVSPDEKISKALFHITENGNSTMVIPDMQTEIELMISHHLCYVDPSTPI